jgi:hypothetical protein
MWGTKNSLIHSSCLIFQNFIQILGILFHGVWSGIFSFSWECLCCSRMNFSLKIPYRIWISSQKCENYEQFFIDTPAFERISQCLRKSFSELIRWELRIYLYYNTSLSGDSFGVTFLRHHRHMIGIDFQIKLTKWRPWAPLFRFNFSRKRRKLQVSQEKDVNFSFLRVKARANRERICSLPGARRGFRCFRPPCWTQRGGAACLTFTILWVEDGGRFPRAGAPKFVSSSTGVSKGDALAASVSEEFSPRPAELRQPRAARFRLPPEAKSLPG